MMKHLLIGFFIILTGHLQAGGGCASFMNVVPVSHPNGCNAISLENLAADAGTNMTWTFSPAAINATTGLPVTSMVVNSSTLGVPPVWPVVYWPQASIPASGMLNIGYDGCTQDFYTCDCNPFAAGSFWDAPLICNTDHYCGNTAAAYIEDFLQNGTPSGGLGANGDGCLFCGSYTTDHQGSIENNSWLKFIADATSVSFNINVFGNCYIQFAVYQYNPAAPLGTNGVLTLMTPMIWTNVDQGFTGNNTITATGLTPGMEYYLHFDGHGGADCDYEIGFSGGIVTSDATASDDLICAGQTVTLTASPQDPSATYTWTDNFGNTYPSADQINVNPTVPTTYSVEILLSGCQNDPQDVLVDIEPCPLPVELTSFEVSCESMASYLTWVTQTEYNNSHFIIEKASEGQSFVPIATIDGAGTSSSPTRYEYYDFNKQKGTSYYRLKQVDLNGEYSLSNELSTTTCLENPKFESISYLNSTNEIMITYQVSSLTDANFNLIDLDGKSIVHKNLLLEPENTSLKIPLNEIQLNRIYLAKFNSADKNIVKRLFISE